TDNQPDFSWLGPYEEKSFTQYFMPYKRIGRIKNATTEAAINLEVENGQAYVAAYVTSPRKVLRLVLRDGVGKVLSENRFDLTPESAFEAQVDLCGTGVQLVQREEHGLKTSATKSVDLELALYAHDGREIVTYRPRDVLARVPSPAEAALPPHKVATAEQLFLTGQHLEQYRHATWEPEAYYREALKRDPTDARNNHALGLLLYRRGRFEDAEKHFRLAIRALTQRNPNPADGEPFYNLGLALRMQGRIDEAFDAFYKSTWNAGVCSAGYFQLAQIASIRGDFKAAIELASQSLI